jgi:RNA polymerase sigma-70 factor (ECF subfamily)
MSEEDDFRSLMERVRTGCDEAAREVFDRYSDHVARVVRRYLHQRLRPQYDSLDFLQAVWASFFTAGLERRRFERPQELIAYLSRMACNKVMDAHRKRLGAHKEGPVLEHPPGVDVEGQPAEAAARQPTPSQVVIAEESWERLLRDQPPPLRRALEMLRQGHSYREIAEEVGLHPKALQRFLQKLTERSGLT